MGFVGVLIAYLQYTGGWHWLAACAAGVLVALAVGLYQGWLTAYVGVPSFVVTLGGLMSFRGAAFLVADGKTQPVTDATFLIIGGGLDGALGVTGSWALAAVAAAVILWRVWVARRAKAFHGFALRPMWAEALLTVGLLALVAGFTAAMCSYQLPGKEGPQGIPVPVVIWGVVVIVMAFIVRRTRFGRYVYAIGGNPEAARLVGIRVRWVTLQLFLLLAVLVAIAAAVSVARLNAGTNSMGGNMELYVIAAAVIGGVSLAGGSGTVLGSVLGALIIQFLDSGLLLLDVSIGKRMVIIGQVLIVAVVFDVVYRRFTGERTA
jgi:D-xylose transport system permease protein